MAHLLFTPPGKAQVRLHLVKDVFVIGRSPDCDLPLDDTVSSRRHCQLRAWAGSHLLEDLSSKNGTFVNGERITSRQLADGDLISVGDRQVVYKAR